MAKIFFRKSVVKNHIQFRDGKRVPFEALGSGWGVIELDEETDAEKIQDLQKFITAKLGGVSTITESDAQALKKSNPPLTREQVLAAKAPRLMSMDSNPLGTKSENARRAAAQASAGPAAVLSPAGLAGAQVSSDGMPQPISRGRKVRTGKAFSPSESITVSAPMPVAAEPVSPASTEVQ